MTPIRELKQTAKDRLVMKTMINISVDQMIASIHINNPKALLLSGFPLLPICIVTFINGMDS